MKSFGNAVVKARHLILILAFVLLVPAVWGYTHTRVNYDILTYLPDSIETIKGQDILMNEFGTGAITMLIVEDKNDKEIVMSKKCSGTTVSRTSRSRRRCFRRESGTHS